MKVSSVFKEHGLSRMWQRLRYADVVLKELDPDLVKAREKESRIHADGPGALVHIDAKRYGALRGGKLIVGLTVVDHFSGFTTLFLCPDGRKTGENSVAALGKFRFPAGMVKLYSDTGSEFVNSAVLGWCEKFGVKSRHTQTGHPWSNGKAERTQALLKREVVIPALVAGQYDSIPELQEALDVRVLWFNHERPHFGKTNQGIPPWTVALECAGMNDADRKLKLAELRSGLRYKNRNAWMKAKLAEAERVIQEQEARILDQESDMDAYEELYASSYALDRARESALEATIQAGHGAARATQEPGES